MSLPGVPKGMNSVCPYLMIADGAKQIEFLQKAFNAQLEHAAKLPDGSVMHAQVRIGDSAE